ncbi:hypothetical protein TVAG_462240 [Trichomonas vaginalis G3]|uniref:Uncharacterized protein n=1 Tax=Trichomonas vaginalis (strain ATCC PRA-98 / G3) TaxID=412133 RepID=A2GHJ7_TRIV3|nr:uncharacterized protein TVAGG3_1078980 [Trichomonas vaginalis G3]EAX83371.1 hypothetical protein TVAG_462240 [Trichomonas vaginalis G3]KAI5482764.1 hypothetical protein TVAGG3_1078980 [Trichomonas vaginalis G3]|eukprot:XP_001296301.1 hypothetical protein [Trichomonas vaginalis G3]
MAQVAQLGKLPRQILLAFRVLPSDRKSSSFRQKKFFPTTRKNFPDDRKKFSSCPSVNHSNFRKLRTFWSNFRKSFSFQQKKFFLPTGKVFPDNWKSSSFRQDTNECLTSLFLNVFQSQKNRQPQHHNRLTKTKHLHFSSLTFYNLNFVRVDMNSERSMRVLYDFVLLP